MSGPTCAVCSRPVEPDDAVEADGRWFCSPGHLLEYEGRDRRRSRPGQGPLRIGALLAVVLAATIVFGLDPFGWRSTSRSQAALATLPSPESLHAAVLMRASPYRGGVHARASVLHCLLARHITVETESLQNVEKSLSLDGATPAGIVGAVPVWSVGRVPISWNGFSAHIRFGSSAAPQFDSMYLVFFKTAALATRAAGGVVAVVFYNAEASEQARADIELLNPPPPLSAIPRLAFVAGNVLVLWAYPRRYTSTDNRVLNQCLS